MPEYANWFGEAAKKAWASKKSGVLEFDDLRVVKKSKMLLVMPDDEEVVRRNSAIIVAFPKLEHFDSFKEAMRVVKEGGPADDNPFAVGTVFVVPDAKGPDGDLGLKLGVTQAHYKVGEEPYLSRSLATKYAGWRMHALIEAIALAKRLETPLIVPKQKGFASASSQAFKDLKKAIQETRASVEEKEHSLVITPLT